MIQNKLVTSTNEQDQEFNRDVAEIRAHLHQKLASLESSLPPGTQTQIHVKEKPGKETGFIFSIRLVTQNGVLEAKGDAENVFVAMNDGTEKLIKKLEEYYQEFGEPERDALVEAVSASRWLH